MYAFRNISEISYLTIFNLKARKMKEIWSNANGNQIIESKACNIKITDRKNMPKDNKQKEKEYSVLALIQVSSCFSSSKVPKHEFREILGNF